MTDEQAERLNAALVKAPGLVARLRLVEPAPFLGRHRAALPASTPPEPGSTPAEQRWARRTLAEARAAAEEPAPRVPRVGDEGWVILGPQERLHRVRVLSRIRRVVVGRTACRRASVVLSTVLVQVEGEHEPRPVAVERFLDPEVSVLEAAE